MYSAGAAGNFLAPISRISANAFKSVIDIDVLGSYNTLKATITQLINSAKRNPVTADGKSSTPHGSGGRIIFVSAAVQYTGLPLQAHACAAKAAVDQLSTAVAIEYGPMGVLSNVIAPGPIGATEGLERLGKIQTKIKATERIPAGRFGSVKDIANATVYLFSDAGNYVNGENLVVDGGAWHNCSTIPSEGFQYPQFLFSGKEIMDVKGRKKSKL